MAAGIGATVWLISRHEKENQCAASAAMNERTVMKQLIYAILGVAVIGGGIALSASRQKNPVVPPGPARTESAASPATENNLPAQPAIATPVTPMPPQPVPADTGESKPAVIASAAEAGARTVDTAIKQAIESLLSPQLTHEQRRDILKKLNEAGKLDQAISELDQRAADNPRNAEYQTMLGQAYLEKGIALQDGSNDKVILVMQAMKSFDVALSDDPANWEARYTRTAILSHYPAEMNKGQEVIDQFTQLINQQEAQPPQAQFAKTYVLLGDQYQKLGQNDYALATWQAGANLFPVDSTLRKRLTQPIVQ
jgi:tetratricopeptide (TPR) repeat protein